jgi:acyl-CoA dehydrogenase
MLQCIDVLVGFRDTSARLSGNCPFLNSPIPDDRVNVPLLAWIGRSRAVGASKISTLKERAAFGKPLIDFHNTRHKSAECETETDIASIHIDKCIERFLAGQLDAVTAAKSKYWLTDCKCGIVDECVQLHGGYGYKAEYPIARMWIDSRVEGIFAGSNETMESMIG